MAAKMSLLAGVLIACAAASETAEEDRQALHAAPEEEAAAGAARGDGVPRPPPAFPAVSSDLLKPSCTLVFL